MPRDFSRMDRISDLIHKELAQLIQQELNDPHVGIVTISGVKVSKDLSVAKIFVSVMMEDQGQKTVERLNKAAGYFRSLLAKRIKIRTIPSLTFILDETSVKANRISKLIDKAMGKDKK